MCLCPDSLFAAAVSSLVTQRLSAFRSYLASAYRLCYAPRLSAESSEPSGKGFVPQPLPPVSSALTAPSRSASTRSLTPRRRPDSFESPSLTYCHQANSCACGGVSPYPSNRPHPVRRLPRPTALPAHLLRDSVRFAPRDSQEVELTHTDGRFRVLRETTGSTRPNRARRMQTYSVAAARPPLSLTVKIAIFVSVEYMSGQRGFSCLLYSPFQLPPSYLCVQDLYCGPHPV